MLQYPFEKFTRTGIFVIEVGEHVVRMGCVDVEPRIVGGRLPRLTIPIEACERMRQRRMIEDDVEDDRHAPRMSLIDEAFIVVGRTVGLVGCKIE